MGRQILTLFSVFSTAILFQFVQESSAYANCSYYPNFPNQTPTKFTRCDYFCCPLASTPENACCSNLWIIGPIVGGVVGLIILICIISIILCLCKVACGCLECLLCPCCCCCD